MRVFLVVMAVLGLCAAAFGAALVGAWATSGGAPPLRCSVVFAEGRKIDRVISDALRGPCREHGRLVNKGIYTVHCTTTLDLFESPDGWGRSDGRWHSGQAPPDACGVVP